jgi:hypothetical protein
LTTKAEPASAAKYFTLAVLSASASANNTKAFAVGPASEALEVDWAR